MIIQKNYFGVVVEKLDINKNSVIIFNTYISFRPYSLMDRTPGSQPGSLGSNPCGAMG